MIDLISFDTGEDIGLADTDTAKAANILSVQVGDLDFAPTVGIDLRFFLSDQFKFQNEGFKAYLVQVLANFGVNVAEIIDEKGALKRDYTFMITDPEQDGALVTG